MVATAPSSAHCIEGMIKERQNRWYGISCGLVAPAKPRVRATNAVADISPLMLNERDQLSSGAAFGEPIRQPNQNLATQSGNWANT
jgi:hypothetical protein